jgi:hypothetical protein
VHGPDTSEHLSCDNHVGPVKCERHSNTKRNGGESDTWKDLSVDADMDTVTADTKHERLIDWNTDVLLNLLGKINVANKNLRRGEGSKSTSATAGAMIDSIPLLQKSQR